MNEHENCYRSRMIRRGTLCAWVGVLMYLGVYASAVAASPPTLDSTREKEHHGTAFGAVQFVAPAVVVEEREIGNFFRLQRPDPAGQQHPAGGGDTEENRREFHGETGKLNRRSCHSSFFPGKREDASRGDE